MAALGWPQCDIILVTGDAYVMDMDGYFHYQARTDDMIISAGYNIASPEVEEALMQHLAPFLRSSSSATTGRLRFGS